MIAPNNIYGTMEVHMTVIVSETFLKPLEYIGNMVPSSLRSAINYAPITPRTMGFSESLDIFFPI